MNMLKSYEFPFCIFFFIMFLMFIWTAVDRNTLRYVQMSQGRHMIHGANVPGTTFQLQWSGAWFRAKEASNRTEGGPNQPRGLGNGEHRSLISIFSSKIARTFSRLNNWISDFIQFLRRILHFSAKFWWKIFRISRQTPEKSEVCRFSINFAKTN